ncbi:hypothetical protein yrohd0001_2410 [Yersinia rohdei ATCC 43380]|nr:hypothetical protein yrohd0001_2410 [Yersinia rohdei ATCC 43380]
MLIDEGLHPITWHCLSWLIIFMGECVAALMSAPDSLNSHSFG